MPFKVGDNIVASHAESEPMVKGKGVGLIVVIIT
jgi:hypothetical protein